MSKERDRLAEEYAERAFSDGSDILSDDRTKNVSIREGGDDYWIHADHIRSAFARGYDTHAEKAQRLVEALELMATSTQFKEGEYGYQFILLANQALTTYRGESQEGEN